MVHFMKLEKTECTSVNTNKLHIQLKKVVEWSGKYLDINNYNPQHLLSENAGNKYPVGTQLPGLLMAQVECIFLKIDG